MSNTHFNIIFKPLDSLNTCKVSEVLPLLKIVAHQNNLKLNKTKDFNKARHILEISILNN